VPAALRCDDELNNAVYMLRQSSIASSTRATYNSGVKLFLVFCTMYGIIGVPVACEDLFIYFVTHCYCRLKLRYSTIRTALAGIRFWYIDKGGLNPFISRYGQPMLRLHYILRSVKKQQGVVSTQRLPITYPVLTDIILLLRTGMFGPYYDLLMQAACLLAFFGFLRCSEFTQKIANSNPQSYIQMKDICIQSETVSVRIKSSKTDPFRQGTWVHLYATGSTLCPVRTLKAFFKTRLRLGALANSDAPFLAMLDGNPLTRYTCVMCLKGVLTRAGLHGDGFTPHSFRKWAATSASVGHVPDHVIKYLGRWSSDCYQRYITPIPSIVQHAMQSMTHFV
jgi:hypothetical protein